MNTSNQATSVWTEQQILQDALISEKHMTDSYNTYAGECVNEQLRNTMLTNLNDLHTIQANIFSTMQQNGWYPQQQAEAKQINQVKSKFTQGS